MKSARIVGGWLVVASCLFGVGPSWADGSTSGSTSATTTMSVADIAAKVQQTYDGITKFEADFDQQFYQKAFDKTTPSKGHVVFVKPGKMRWDYKDPDGNVTVSDGTTLWQYIASDKIARKMAVKNTQMSAALSFLLGKGSIASEFDLVIPDGAKFEGGYVLKGKPKTPTNAYDSVFFYVDGTTWQIRRVLIVDQQQNRNRFDFKEMKTNDATKIDDKVFSYHPPADAQISEP